MIRRKHVSATQRYGRRESKERLIVSKSARPWVGKEQASSKEKEKYV